MSSGLVRRLRGMGIIRSNISVSLDGYVAGPEQGEEHPLGGGGMRLHEWVFRTAKWNELHGREGGEPGPDSDIVGRMAEGIGAYVMGRNMFSPGRGEWDESWRGWWGEDPPFPQPVFVLTHHERAPLEM